MNKGFTLIELLVVMGIMAVLMTATIIALNPAEELRQARDATRISDLANYRAAISLYLSSVSAPDIGNPGNCYVHAGAGIPAGTGCNGRFLGGATTEVNSQSVNGSGWVPIDFDALTPASPLVTEPVDPVNNAMYFYGYRPAAGFLYELNAKMESAKFSFGGGGDVESNTKDGGNEDHLYEAGVAPGLAL